MALDRVKKVPLYEIAYENIKASILSGELKSGTPLNQSEVAAQMGISRMPIRDALRILEKENLIEYNKNQGYIVADFPKAKIMDILLIRSILEPKAVLLCKGKLTDENIKAMEDIVSASMVALEMSDFKAVRQFNHDFHYTIYNTVGSPTLLDIIDKLWHSYPKYFLQEEKETKYKSLMEHGRIVACMKAGDFEKAAGIMEHHISLT